MKQLFLRALSVFGAQLVAFELLLQLSVHWRESTGELALMGLGVATLPACAWVVLPILREIPRWPPRVIRGALEITLLFVTLNVVDYFYSWHVRPNLGLYREPDWVQQHPGFQRELRSRIAANIWRSKAPGEERQP